MDELYDILKNYTLQDAIEMEYKDLQFLALKKSFEKLNQKDIFLALIFVNSIVCYQLSSTWEKYWEEFSIQISNYFQDKNINDTEKPDEIIKFFYDFLPNCKWNKRLVETKLKRIEKIKPFLENFIKNQKYFYENMNTLLFELSNIMNQKPTDKTMVFAIKMFWYWARIYFDKLITFDEKISIPLDSRIEKIYNKYNKDSNLSIKDFYNILSKKLNIPQLHLDWLIWSNEELTTI